MAKLLLNANGKVLMKDDKVYKAPESTLKKLLDTTKSAQYLFNGYTGTSVDDLISYNDTENVTQMQNMFSNCNNITTIPLLDTSQVTNMNSMFNTCSKLQSVPLLNTSKVTRMMYMFQNCSNLTTIPQLDTSNVTTMNSMFMSCKSLETIPPLDTSNVTNMGYMFQYCEKLMTISQLNLIKVSSNISDFLYGCSSLTNLTLLNIKINITIGEGTSWGHLLTLDSLINTIKELVNMGASRTLTMGSANLEKIANVYVRRTTEGDIPTCLSDNSNIDLAKAPCEVCESTDEGAMLITAYANSKNWTLA